LNGLSEQRRQVHAPSKNFATVRFWQEVMSIGCILSQIVNPFGRSLPLMTRMDHPDPDRSASGGPKKWLKLLVPGLLFAILSGCTACSCKDLGKISGSAEVEFAPGTAYASCSGTPPPDSAKEACEKALDNADALARSQCKNILVRMKDAKEDQACITTNTHMFPKGPNLCGVSTTTTRKYKCCDLPDDYEELAPPAAPQPKHD
jgi:hypothetical protein